MPELKVDLTLDDSNFKDNLNKDKDHVKEFSDATKKGGDDLLKFVEKLNNSAAASSGTRRKLAELTKLLQDTMVAYRSLSKEEQASAQGLAMALKIDELKQKAGELKDTIIDAQSLIKYFASDTGNLDSFISGLDLAKSSMQAFVGITALMGDEGQDYARVLTIMATAEATFAAAKKVSDYLLKESDLMQGISIIQSKAAAAATNINAAAQGTLASKLGLATVAQKAFNLVAAANPYVLLAMAAVAAISAISAFIVSQKKAERLLELTNRMLERQKQLFKDLERDISEEQDILRAEGKTETEVLTFARDKYKEEHRLAKLKLDDAKLQYKQGKLNKDLLQEYVTMEQNAYENLRSANHRLNVAQITDKRQAEEKKLKAAQDAINKEKEARRRAAEEEKRRQEEKEKFEAENPVGSFNRMNATIKDLQDRLSKLNMTTKEGQEEYKKYQNTIDLINERMNSLKNEMNIEKNAEQKVSEFFKNVGKGSWSSAQEISALIDLMDQLQWQIGQMDVEKGTEAIDNMTEKVETLYTYLGSKLRQALELDIQDERLWNDIDMLEDKINGIKELMKTTWDEKIIERYWELIRKYTARKIYLEAEVNLKMGDIKTSKEWAKDVEEYKQAWIDADTSVRKHSWQMATSIYGATTSIIDSVNAMNEQWEDMTPYEKFANICDLIINSVNLLVGIIDIIDNITEALKRMKAAMDASRTASAQQQALQSAEQASNAATSASNVGVAVSESAKQGAKLPFPANIAAIAASVAAVVAAITMIASLSNKAKKYAQGGIIEGTSSVGDRQMAYVNSGEMIMNKGQQSRLWNWLNGNIGGILKDSLDGKEVNFRISGDTLVGVLRNYDRIHSRR